jgi:hypothetical protein
MHCSRTIAALTFAILAAGLAWGQKASRQPLVAPTNIASAKPKTRMADQATGPVVTPATVNFAATNPSTLPSVLGTPGTTYTYTDANMGGTGSGSLTVSATGFTGGAGCANIPVSAVTVTCTSVQSTQTCMVLACAPGSPQLTAGGVAVVNGTVTSGTCAPNVTISLNYNFADNWKYTAETCSLIVTYNIVGT